MEIIPFDKRIGFIWLNGVFVEWQNATTHVLNHGLHYGSCVFEGLRVYASNIYKLEKHTDRLFHSANRMGIEIPYSKEALNQAQLDTIKKMKIDYGYIRPVIWRGSEMMAISAQKNKINVAIATWEWPSYFSPEDRLKGISLQTADWRRPPSNSIPTDAKAAGLYMICTLSKHKAEKEGFTDALMLDVDGKVCESTGSNIFFVFNGELHTPIPHCFLDGITRQTAISIAKNNGIKVVERDIFPEEIKEAQEIFLTGSAVEITPVGKIDKQEFKIGEITKLISELYLKEVDTNYKK
ncbi:MAG: branched-chain amino acid aminotransferase [Pelagibacteraceae bacterium]|nr:branched-chain amino acid aminotransferase [Pelagibacteraceae bacterium]|tara:strand:+ start:1564 stop:2448 length:885 start_codon:yes stop_codon:yes gene_type:complete